MPSVETIMSVGVGAIFLFFWLTAFIILYHLSRFGIGVFPKKLAALFMLGSLALFTWALVAYLKLDLSHINLSAFKL